MLGAVRRSTAGVVRHAARRQPADRRQRVDRAARARPGGRAAHDARAARRAVRRDPRARAAGTRPVADHASRCTSHRPSARSTPPGARRATACSAPVLRRLLDRIDQRVVVSKDALALVQRHLGGDDDDYTVLFNGVETAEIRAAAPLPVDATGDLLPRPARGAQGSRRSCCRRCALLDADVVVLGRRRRARHGTAADRARRRRADRVAGPDHRGRQAGPPPRRLGVLRAVAARRVVRRRAGRGDGGRHARGRQRARRLPQRGDRRASTRCSSSPAIATALAAALERVLVRPALADGAGRQRHAIAPTSSRCRGWPTSTWRSTSRLTRQ